MHLSLFKAAICAAFFSLYLFQPSALASGSHSQGNIISDPSIQCSLANGKVLITLTSTTFSGQVVVKTSDKNSLTMTSSPNAHQNFRFGEEQLPISLKIYPPNSKPVSYLIDAACEFEAH